MTQSPKRAPIFFSPLFKEKIWGGQTLASRLQKKIPANTRIGEAWELSDCSEGPSLVSRPTTLAGQTLGGVFASDKTAIGGPCCTNSPQFPLLYKFLDATDNLSVQVHPDDDLARIRGYGNFGKTECWYIVDARPGARLVCGFRNGVTVANVAAAVKNNTLDALLNYIDVVPGDLIFVPARTVHAILGGILLYEIQETSDATLRLYDWGRLDDSGKPRTLHVDDALGMIDTSYHTLHKIPPVRLRNLFGAHHLYRVACRYFLVEEFLFPRQLELPITRRSSFQVMTLLDGCLTLTIDGNAAQVMMGETVLIPASGETIVASADTGCRFLLSSIPDLDADVVAPLRSQGIPDDRIELLGGNHDTNDLMSLLRK